MRIRRIIFILSLFLLLTGIGYAQVGRDTAWIEIKKGWNLVSIPGASEGYYKGTCKTDESDWGLLIWWRDDGRYINAYEFRQKPMKEADEYLLSTSFWLYSPEDCKFKLKIQYVKPPSLTDCEFNPSTNKWICDTGTAICKMVEGGLEECQPIITEYKSDKPYYEWTDINDIYDLRRGSNFVSIIKDMLSYSLNELRGNCTIESINTWDAENQNWSNISPDEKLDNKMIGQGLVINVADDCKLFFVGE